MAMRTQPGTRVIHESQGPATVIAPDDCEVLKKHSDRNQNWRDSFIWFKFDLAPTVISFRERFE